MLNTTIQTSADKTTVTLVGCLDTAAANQFQQAIEPLLTLSSTLIEVDCSQLEYISSSGLRQFIILLKQTKANQSSLTLLHLTDAVMEVFRMTGFVNIFRIE